MRYIKTNTEAEALAICQRVFDAANADGKFPQGTTAYAIPEKVEYYEIPVLDGFDSYFTNVELSGIEQFAEEKQGRTILDDMFFQLKSSNLTPTQISQLINTILATIVAILAGSLRAARILCNNTNTTTVFTAARKTWLLNRIDEEIAKL